MDHKAGAKRRQLVHGRRRVGVNVRRRRRADVQRSRAEPLPVPEDAPHAFRQHRGGRDARRHQAVEPVNRILVDAWDQHALLSALRDFYTAPAQQHHV